MPPLQFTPEEVEKSEGTIEIISPFVACTFETLQFPFRAAILFSIREISIQRSFFISKSNDSYENLWRKETIGYAYKRLALVRNLGSKI